MPVCHRRGTRHSGERPWQAGPGNAGAIRLQRQEVARLGRRGREKGCPSLAEDQPGTGQQDQEHRVCGREEEAAMNAWRVAVLVSLLAVVARPVAAQDLEAFEVDTFLD